MPIKQILRAALIAFSVPLFTCFSTKLALAEDTDCKIEQESKDLLDLHNQARSEARMCGSKHMPPVPKLKWNCQLSMAAEIHASDMHQGQFLRHQGSDGRSFKDRISNVGFRWVYAAENIGLGYPNSSSVHSAWLGSDTHCVNIMNENYLYMAAARSGEHWVAVFAR